MTPPLLSTRKQFFCLCGSLLFCCTGYAETPAPLRTPAPAATETPKTFQVPEALPALEEEFSEPGMPEKRPALPTPPIPSQAQIEKIMNTLQPGITGVGAPASDRTTWDLFLNQPQSTDLIHAAEDAMRLPIPELTAGLWQRYARTGDRHAYQKAFRARLDRLADLSLGEALEYEGRFLPEIERNLKAILDQQAWSVPAHGESMQVFYGEEHVVDLAASQIAWTLATIDYWLQDVLPADLRARLHAEIEERILTPYRAMIYEETPAWWMIRPNNWTAVCVGSITGAALTLETDPAQRAEFIAIARILLPRYLSSTFSAEGLSEEGLNYWSYGFSHFLFASESIRKATGGSIDLLADPQVFRISQSPRNQKIANGVYPPFGDQPVHQSGERTNRLVDFAAMRYGLPNRDTRFDQIEPGWRHPLGPQLYSLIVYSFGEEAPRVADFAVPPEGEHQHSHRSWFFDGQLFICRPDSGNPDALSMALTVGNNGKSHNHNDIGSYIVVKGDTPVLVDPGMDIYTKDSFGPHRYESQMNNSFGHPVPLVANRMQQTGRQAHGTVLESTATDRVDTLKIDLTQAYRSPGLDSLLRTVRYTRPDDDNAQEGSVEIVDRIRFDSPRAFSTSLVTLGEFQILDPNTVQATYRGVSLYIRIETDGSPHVLDEVPVKGFRTSGKPDPRRLGVYLTQPVEAASIHLKITPTPPAAPPE